VACGAARSPAPRFRFSWAALALVSSGVARRSKREQDRPSASVRPADPMRFCGQPGMGRGSARASATRIAQQRAPSIKDSLAAAVRIMVKSSSMLGLVMNWGPSCRFASAAPRNAAEHGRVQEGPSRSKSAAVGRAEAGSRQGRHRGCKPRRGRQAASAPDARAPPAAGAGRDGSRSGTAGERSGDHRRRAQERREGPAAITEVRVVARFPIGRLVTRADEERHAQRPREGARAIF